MAAPTIPTVAAGRVLTKNQADTSTTRTFPDLSGLTKNDKDLLIAIVVSYATGSGQVISSWSDGFIEFLDTNSGALAIGAAYKWSDGTETGTPTATYSVTPSGHASMILLSIPGAHATSPPEAGGRANGTTSNADPSSRSPTWGAEDTLWIAVGANGEASASGTWTGIASAPTNYTNYVDTATADTSTLGQTEAAVAFRQLNAATEDMGPFSGDISSAVNSALIIPVRPAAAVPVTYYGITASAFTFGEVVSGFKQTFGQTATELTFIKVVSGIRTAFGQIAAPFIFVKDVIGQRKTFSQIAAPFTFSKAVSGFKQTFGQTTTAITFVKSVSGNRIVNTLFGIVAMPITFTKEIVGQRKTFGQTATSLTFSKAVSGFKKTFGQIASSFIFVKDLKGQKQTFGKIGSTRAYGTDVYGSSAYGGSSSGATVVVFGVVTAGIKVANTLYGIVTFPIIFAKNIIGQRNTFSQISVPFTFVKSVSGQRKTFGQIVAPFIFAKDVKGQRKTFSRIDLPLIFTDLTSGQKQTFGQVGFPISINFNIIAETQGIRFGQTSMSLVFHKDIVGTRKTFGKNTSSYFLQRATKGVRKTFSKIDRPFTFAKETSGRRKTFGRSALPLNASIIVAGQRRDYGQVSISLLLGEQTVGQKETFGQSATVYAFDSELQGLKETFGFVDFPIDFIVDTNTGRVEAYSSLALEFILSLETAGMVRPREIILNLAKAIYLGSTSVDAVYTNSQKVWPK